MKKLSLLLGAIFSISVLYAQVGIGNPSPNAGSILDLTNSNNKALLMPVSNTSPTSVTSFNTTAMLLYYNNLMYTKTSYGYNAISPWRFTGDTTSGVYVPSGLSIGIGLTPITSSPVRLHVSQGAAEITLTGTNGSIAIGDVAAQHILIDNNEIMSKSATSTEGILKLQEEAGSVEVRTGAARTTNTVLTANGNIDASKYGRIREHGFDLLPVGSVIMWFGTVNAAGYPLVGGVADSTWHVCDGGTYSKMDGTGTVATPDLRERFIVGAGLADNAAVTGTTQYAVGAGGNANNFITLTAAQIPAHTHPASASPDPGHTHSYNDLTVSREDVNGSDFNNQGINGVPDNARTTGTGGAHNHTITVSANTGGGGSHENRPPYYALYFLMKL